MHCRCNSGTTTRCHRLSQRGRMRHRRSNLTSTYKTLRFFTSTYCGERVILTVTLDCPMISSHASIPSPASALQPLLPTPQSKHRPYVPPPQRGERDCVPSRRQQRGPTDGLVARVAVAQLHFLPQPDSRVKPKFYLPIVVLIVF